MLNSWGLVLSRSVTELNSCGLARNKIVVPSSSAWTADCKSAAAQQGRDCRRTACCRTPAATARKSGRCWKSLGRCRCN